MTPLLFAVAAAVGALGRHVVGQLVCSWAALLWVNTVGAGVLAFVVTSDWSTATTTVLGVGFCGALTTMSSTSLETRSFGWRWGLPYATLMLVMCLGAVGVGTTLAN